MSPRGYRAHLYSSQSVTQESETHVFAQLPASKQAAGQGRPVRQRTSQNRLGRTASGAIRAPSSKGAEAELEQSPASLFFPSFFFF